MEALSFLGIHRNQDQKSDLCHGFTGGDNVFMRLYMFVCHVFIRIFFSWDLVNSK